MEESKNGNRARTEEGQLGALVIMRASGANDTGQEGGGGHRERTTQLPVAGGINETS